MEQFVSNFAEPGDPEYAPPVQKAETKNYETTRHRIKREFEAYGPIKQAHLVTDKATNEPRGYAFVEYMHTQYMKKPQQIASAHAHSEEPREKSRERGRDRDREHEKSRERSHDKMCDRDPREDRHHRDDDRSRDRERERLGP
ncbi:hypothetical protein MRB53_009490 [Persea americana]|uniref:Uncharacterized protein n=1 Tax=Persea americana TaxID=3435 RepID=A0ACC2LPV7_PERAE|nr:hypothetical protein MRB53_009490 [Persea americana]